VAPGADGCGIITLLTDFGARDAYVGVMKGVILRALPRATVVDLTHGVPPREVLAGALALEGAFPYFPEGTVHVAVVDPGVGGPRRILAAEAGGHAFLGPDNGILSLALDSACLPRRSRRGQAGGPRAFAVSETAIARAQATALPPGARESSTFHGRDRFAPLAAVMAGLVADGSSLDELGTPVEDFERLAVSSPERRESGEIAGEVIYVDGFGNLVTNISPDDLPETAREGPEFEVADLIATGFSRAYVDVESGAPLAIVGSTGRVEISVRDGSAARESGACVGTKVFVRSMKPHRRTPNGDGT